jgi:hypothetical protein
MRAVVRVASVKVAPPAGPDHAKRQSGTWTMADYQNRIIDRPGTDGRIGRVAPSRPGQVNALSRELLF